MGYIIDITSKKASTPVKHINKIIYSANDEIERLTIYLVSKLTTDCVQICNKFDQNP